ncbi:hypothetical protein LSCM1_04947 [Leishmania martiniquensis]|uniref:SAC domain-containing protein n=1 Tax=Leishmania martiniquensis TaxID=1580590 RepID=A0A836H250_9TRYP|nr:hypothetical protein LSCM1_04947 [Leishmania martiniquensis]
MQSNSTAARDEGSPPRHRCAIAVKNNVQYLFVVVPKSKPPPKMELEPLMFFESPSPAPRAAPDACQTEGLYAPKGDALKDSAAVPLAVNSSGELQRAVVFPATEFASLDDARQQCGPFTSFQEYPALFGCLRIDKVYVLVATAVAVAVSLPFAGTIYNVKGTAWVPFDLPGVAPVRVSQTDRTRLREFQHCSYSIGYYFSDDVDLMLPFPFTRPDGCAPPDTECNWSHHLHDSFSRCSLGAACSVLVRGFAGERVCTLKDGVDLHLVLLGRQSNVNPGPRYLSRGLNSENGVGNDHYYEYILWKYHGADTVTFTRHSFLRGTIPVHWRTQLSMSLSEPAMIFSGNKAEVLRGSVAYFDRTFQRLKHVMLLDTNGCSASSPQLRCINLLRLNPQSGEDVLARHFLDAVRASDAFIKKRFVGGSLDLVHVDWLNLIKDYGIDMATSTFWEASVGFLGTGSTAEDSMMTVGMIRRTGEVDRLVTQSRFLRLNCADSLDRTNLGCFFLCLQLCIAMLLTQRIPYTSFPESPLVPALDASDEVPQEGGYAAAFAPMVGARQAVPKPFVSAWGEVRDPRCIPPVIVRALAELFVHNGDCVAMLYTNSAAMHSNILRGICGMRLQGHNAVIATQRKFENVFEDRKKLRGIQLLLGRNDNDLFPSISQVFLLRPVAYKQWACAVVVVGVPDAVTVREVEVTVRRAWDASVVSQLAVRQLPPIESTALCFTVTLSKVHAQQEAGYCAHSNKESDYSGCTLAPDDPVDDGISENGTTHPRSERIAIIEFDPDLCTVVDAATMLRQQGFLPLSGNNCILAPYSYALHTTRDASTMSGTVKTVGSSLKRGLTSFMRGLT